MRNCSLIYCFKEILPVYIPDWNYFSLYHHLFSFDLIDVMKIDDVGFMYSKKSVFGQP